MAAKWVFFFQEKRGGKSDITIDKPNEDDQESKDIQLSKFPCKCSPSDFAITFISIRLNTKELRSSVDRHEIPKPLIILEQVTKKLPCL